MAVVKIEEIYLYAGTAVPNVAENLEAVAFMDHSGIPYIKLQYNDAQQQQETLNAVNTWWTRPDIALPPLTGYPFVTYTEVCDNIPARMSPVKYLAGLSEIKRLPDILAALPK